MEVKGEGTDGCGWEVVGGGGAEGRVGGDGQSFAAMAAPTLRYNYFILFMTALSYGEAAGTRS